MQSIEGLKPLLGQKQPIAIFSHRNPDGDAIGSSLALQHYLEKLGHDVHVFVPSNFPPFLAFLPQVENIMVWDDNEAGCKAILDTKKIFFFLDFNSLSRIDRLGEYVDTLEGTRVLIDHHLFPDDCAEFVLSETTASSTCELIYEAIRRWDGLELLDKTIGTCLYTGIVTDTGSFRYATNPRLFRIVAELVHLGVEDTYVQDKIYNSSDEKTLRLLGHCLTNRMEYYPEYHTAMIWLSKKDYETYDIQRGDTEGIVNYLLTIQDVKMAVFIHNQPTVVKLSLRSKGDFDVQEIAQKFFKGGGHKNASGAHSFMSLKKTIEKFEGILPLYKDELQKPF